MSLEKLSKTVDFVQATTPSNANDGETYLDTSQSPPQLKVFDSNAGTFVQPRSIQNLDQRVSNAGASQSDIETAVDNSSTASTVSNNLDIPVSNAGKTATDTDTDKNSQSEIQSGVDNSTTGNRVDTTISSRSSHNDPDPNGYIDQRISNAGKTATATDTDKNSTSEIATGVDNSTTASTVSNNLDAKVSNAGKTATSPESVLNNATHFTASAKENDQTTTTFTLATGSGFIVTTSANANGDGKVKSIKADNGPDIANKNQSTLIRFENKVETTLEGGFQNSDDAQVSIDGIFD